MKEKKKKKKEKKEKKISFAVFGQLRVKAVFFLLCFTRQITYEKCWFCSKAVIGLIYNLRNVWYKENLRNILHTSLFSFSFLRLFSMLLAC